LLVVAVRATDIILTVLALADIAQLTEQQVEQEHLVVVLLAKLQ
jgi:hypothetical protein